MLPRAGRHQTRNRQNARDQARFDLPRRPLRDKDNSHSGNRPRWGNWGLRLGLTPDRMHHASSTNIPPPYLHPQRHHRLHPCNSTGTPRWRRSEGAERYKPSFYSYGPIGSGQGEPECRGARDRVRLDCWVVDSVKAGSLRLFVNLEPMRGNGRNWDRRSGRFLIRHGLDFFLRFRCATRRST